MPEGIATAPQVQEQAIGDVKGNVEEQRQDPQQAYARLGTRQSGDHIRG